MTDQPRIKIDVNHADAEQLSQVPGIGPALAERIIESRPYAMVDDLRNVSGISTQSLEKMHEYLICEPADESPPAEPEIIAESAMEVADSSAEPEHPLKEAPEHAPEKMPHSTASKAEPAPARDEFVRRSDGLWWGIGLAIVVLILSLVFSLGTLNIVNRTLSYAPASQVQAMDTRVEELSTQIQAVNDDLNSLRTRMDALEALSGRIANLESDNQSLHSELESLQAQADELESKSQELTQQVSELQKSSARFQNFLDGLRQLLETAGGQ